MWNRLKVAWYIARARRAYEKQQQAQCDAINARSEAGWLLEHRIKPLSEEGYKRWKYLADYC